MAVNASTLLQMINAIKNAVVFTFNGRKPDDKGNIRLTEKDIQDSVAPDKFIKGSGISKISVGDTAPDNPNEGDLWIDTSSL